MPARKSPAPKPAAGARKRPSRNKHQQPKPRLHPRNPHAGRYDLAALTQSLPELAEHVFTNEHGNQTVDFADPQAVKRLNQALLKHYYRIDHWGLPEGYLCPPVPSRAEYIHQISELLAATNEGKVPVGRKVRGLDIGTGANLIYPIIGSQSYGWRFTGVDIDATALASARLIAESNPVLKPLVQVRAQSDPQQIFSGVIGPADRYAFTLCNPPFHENAQAAAQGSARKVRNLSKGQADKVTLNFAGQANELWCPGGELAFVSRMIEQSRAFGEQVLWFTSLISKSDNLAPLRKALEQAGAAQVKTLDIVIGNKISRALAWSFMTGPAQQTWARQVFHSGVELRQGQR